MHQHAQKPRKPAETSETAWSSLLASARALTHGHEKLLAIALGAFLARAGWAILTHAEIDTEGAEYGTIAKNLLAGNGYSGIASEGKQLFFPPLFPFMIVAMTWIVGDIQIAGRLVNVLFGSLIVIPVYLIGRHMFDHRAGLISAALVGFHPYLVSFSTTMYCEPFFLTLIASAICATMYAIATPTWRLMVVAGALYGASYLVRPEALIYMLVGMACIPLGWLAHNQLRANRDKAYRLLLVPLAFLVVAGPYIGWLSYQSGHLRLQGKGTLNMAAEVRKLPGQHVDSGGMAIDANLNDVGAWNQPNINTIATFRPKLSDVLTMVSERRKSVVKDGTAIIAAGLGFGSPALFALAILGFFGRAWRPGLIVSYLHLGTLLAIAIVATFMVSFTLPRFYILFLLFFSILAGAAAWHLRSWAQRTAILCGLSQPYQKTAIMVVWGLAAAAVILPALGSAVAFSLYVISTRPVKELAMRVAATPGPIIVSDANTPFAFHARAKLVWLPFTDEKTALRYLRKKQVTHIVIRSNLVENRPYLKKWLAEGIPGVPLLESVKAGSETVKVYHLARAATP